MKYLKIKKLKPQFTTVLTTLDVFEDDLFIDGILAAPKGSLKTYQRVLAVGDAVRTVKEGDLVLLDFTNYIRRQYKDNSIKEDIATMEDVVSYDIPKMVIDDRIIGKFQDRDIQGIILEHEEIEGDTPKATLI